MTVSRKVIVTNEKGIHARPSALITKTAARFRSTISIQKGDKRADAKSILAVLTLAASKGTELVLEADGEDEEAALMVLAPLFSSKFNDFN